MDFAQILAIGQLIGDAITEINRLSSLISNAMDDIKSGNLTAEKVEEYYQAFKINNTSITEKIDDKINKLENNKE